MISYYLQGNSEGGRNSRQHLLGQQAADNDLGVTDPITRSRLIELPRAISKAEEARFGVTLVPLLRSDRDC
jgi:hypothetical protein